MAPRNPAAPGFDPLPRPYFLFFTLVEPFLTILGSLYAIFLPHTYYPSLHPSFAAPPTSPPAIMAIRQLGSCFFLFALFGAVLVPIVTKQLTGKGMDRELETIVKAYLGCLAAADVTHVLFTLYDLGRLASFSPFTHWNSLVWGNVGITAGLFAVRMMWFAAVGRQGTKGSAKKA
ncbi:hypothetical protein JCM11251_005770 [Rhodosporidiobolus azoricus]